jgi:hypothetical protein
MQAMFKLSIIRILLGGLLISATTETLAQIPSVASRLTGQVRDESGAVMQTVAVRVFQGDDAEPLAKDTSR